jgi:hypothetical protein
MKRRAHHGTTRKAPSALSPAAGRDGDTTIDDHPDGRVGADDGLAEIETERHTELIRLVNRLPWLNR